MQARSDAGFSLVEMMMVVAIIGLMTSAVVLVMPSKDDNFTDALKRTERAFIALSRQSVMTGQVLGARFQADRFAVQILTEDGWQEKQDILKPEATEWGPLFLSALQVAGADVDFSEETTVPHVWFLPTSETSEFRLSLSAAGQTGQISMNSTGKVEARVDD